MKKGFKRFSKTHTPFMVWTGSFVTRTQMVTVKTFSHIRFAHKFFHYKTFEQVQNFLTKKPDSNGVRLYFAVWTGLEPATPCVTGRYSNQLNYQTNIFFESFNFLKGHKCNIQKVLRQKMRKVFL